MINTTNENGLPPKTGHLKITEPSPWVVRFAPLIRTGGSVLDVACGAGRHSRFLLGRGHTVTAVDRDVSHIRGLDDAEIIEHDLEDGGPWLFPRRQFAGIVVANYLYRPLFPHLMEALEPGGVLIYETFARGNELYSRPRNPAHLLEEGELLECVAGRLHVVAFEQGLVDKRPCPGVVQRICAIDREDQPQPL